MISLSSDGKTFNSLFYYSEQFSPQFIARLEDRMADVVDELPAGQSRGFHLNEMSNWIVRSRPRPHLESAGQEEEEECSTVEGHLLLYL